MISGAMPFAAFLFILLAAEGAVLRGDGPTKTTAATGSAPVAIVAPPSSKVHVFAALQLAVAQPELVRSLLGAQEAASLQKQLGALTLALGAEASEAAELRLQGIKGSDVDNGLQDVLGPGGNTIAGIIGLDMKKLNMAAFGPLLIVACVLAVLGAICFEMVHYKWAEADLSLELEYGQEEKTDQLSRMFAGIRPLISPYFCNPENRTSWRYLGTLAVLGVIDLCFGLIFMLWMKEFWDSIENKREEKFMRLMRDFCLLVGAWVIVGTYTSYIGMMMSIHWRKFLTEYLLTKWLHKKAYYHLQLAGAGDAGLDNPDQRLQEDVPKFITQTLLLGGGFCSTMGQFCTMLPLLLILSPDYAFGVFYCPGWLVYLALIYSGTGTLAAHAIGNKLILINFALQKYEANFRYGIVQVRDHAESIALYGSEDVEKAKIEEKFAWLVRAWWMLMKYTKRLGFFISFYYQTSATFPYLALAPNYFKGQISLGTMFMLFSALGMVKGGFDWLIASYTTLTDYRATVDRLWNFVQAVEEAPEKCSTVEVLGKAPENEAGALVVAKDFSVSLPGKEGKKIWENAGLVIKPGQFVLLSAPEGTGKSCFFRALAGIWPHATGSIYKEESSLFLPQKAYVPQGTLKQAVTYPNKAENYTDEEVRKALEIVKLETVRDRELDEDANWEMSLSGGEQQRLAIAHAVLLRPKALFLDEATSALSEEGTLEVYNLLRKKGTLPEGASVISISHDLNLLNPVHDVHYCYDPETSNWIEKAK